MELNDRDLLLPEIHSGLDLTILDPPKETYTKVQSYFAIHMWFNFKIEQLLLCRSL